MSSMDRFAKSPLQSTQRYTGIIILNLASKSRLFDNVEKTEFQVFQNGSNLGLGLYTRTRVDSSKEIRLLQSIHKQAWKWLLLLLALALFFTE